MPHIRRVLSQNNTNKMPEADKLVAAQQAVDVIHEIATILVRQLTFVFGRMNVSIYTDCRSQNCHLDRRTLSICISLIERGVNPEALAVRSIVLYHWFIAQMPVLIKTRSKLSRSFATRAKRWNNMRPKGCENRDLPLALLIMTKAHWGF